MPFYEAWGLRRVKSSVIYCKRHILAWLYVVWAILLEDRLGSSLWGRDRKKVRKSREANIGMGCRRFRCWVISTSGLGLCFYFRFVPDVVLRSRITSVPVEVDRACPKTAS